MQRKLYMTSFFLFFLAGIVLPIVATPRYFTIPCGIIIIVSGFGWLFEGLGKRDA